MADERASITLTLTDEMSDKLATINAQVDTLRNRFETIGTTANRSFTQAHEAAAKLPAKLNEIDKLIEKTFGQQVRRTMEDFARTMGDMAGRTLGMTSAMGTAAATATRFALAIGGAVGATTAWVAAGLAASYAIYKISEAINRAHQESLNFQKQIGASETQIRSWTVAAEALGMTSEEARGSMQRLTAQVQDLVRGGYAPLARELIQFGEKGVQTWEAVRQAQQEGRNDLEQTQVLLQQIGTWNEAAQRRISLYFGINLRQMQLWMNYQREVAQIADSPRARDAMRFQEEASGKVADNWFRIKLELEKLRPMWDYIKGGFFVIVNELATMLLGTLRAVNAVVDFIAIAFGKVKEVIQWLIDNTPQWVKNIVNVLTYLHPTLLAIRGIRALGQETPEQREQREQRERQGPRPAPPMTRTAPPGRREDGERPPPMTVPQRFGGGGDGGYQFHPDLGWAGQLHGQESRNIEDRRELVMGEREQTSYLREMRDVLVWMQMQMAGPAGAGAGAGAPQRFGGGGGGGGGGAGLLGAGRGGAGLGGGMGGLGGGRGGGGTTGLGSGSAPYAPQAQARIGMPGGEFERPTLTGGLPEGGRGAAPPPLWMSPEGADRWRDQLGGGSQGVASGGAPGAGGGANPIAAERARVMAQLNEPATRDLAAWMIGHEQETTAGRADVLESLVNRAVVTGKHPRDLLTGGFYGPINRFKKAHGRLPTAQDWALKDFDAAHKDVAAGRNVLGGRTDQGMIKEVKPQGRMESRGEYYGWMGLKGERATAAARGGPGPAQVAGPGQPPGLPPSVGAAPDQRGRPDYFGGTVSIDGQTFHYGTGGGRTPSLPFGTHNINPAWTGEGQLGDVGRRIGSIATLGGRGGEIWDPREGRERLGIQIHAASSDDLDRLYSAGCFAVARSEWPRFKAALQKKITRDGPLALTVLPNGQAVVHSRGAAPENATQFAAKTVRTEKITAGATAGPPPSGGPSMALPGAGAAAPPTGRFTPGPTGTTGPAEPHAAPPTTTPPTDLQVLERAERFYGITPPAGAQQRAPRVPARAPPMRITGTSFMGEQQRARQQDDDAHGAHDDSETRSNRMVTGRQWIAHRGQAQPVIDRTAIDRSIAGQQNAGRIGKGRLDVHFWNAPRGMRARGKGTDALEDMNIKQTPHMARSAGAQAPPAQSPQQYADEE
jgi:hypothetical protein